MTRMTAGLLVASLVCALAPTAAHAQPARSDACRPGYVWREALPGDHVCVTPATREQAAQDNSQADTRRQPAGGAYGPNTCLDGYVWREARPGDVVCVKPETRAQTAADNREAAARRAAAAPAAPSAPPSAPSAPSAPPATPPSPTAAYRTGEWSQWARGEGVQYRYRWGLNPQNKTNVDALFQIKNMQTQTWQGAVRSLDCSQDQLARSQSVVLKPNETKDVKFLTPNCGTMAQPSFRPNVVKSRRID
jgi:hypothetical protein